MSKKMSSPLSKKSLSKDNLSSDGWDDAISEAKRQIDEAKKRITTLKFTIKTFEHLKESGAPFPSEKPKRRTRGAKQSEAKL